MLDVPSPYVYMAYHNVALGQFFFPLLMLFLFYLSGYYNTNFQRSGIKELLTTCFSAFIASLIIYFIILINDNLPERHRNYELIAVMWASVATCVYIPRLFFSCKLRKNIKKGKMHINTLIIGKNLSADSIRQTLSSDKSNYGYHIVGQIPFPEEQTDRSSSRDTLDNIDEICRNQDIQNIIIVPFNRTNKEILHTISKLFHLNIPLKIAPEMYDIVTSSVRHINMTDEPFIDIAQSNMPEWQKSVKRFLDIVLSFTALTILSPLFLVVAILIKADSKGPVFYKQERMGKSGIPFMIFKFRTMKIDAEQSGVPQLTSSCDPRITKIGKILRKYRIDETPQFLNVILGNMSIVGPRPERNFFARQIIKQAPYYTLTYQIRPGITSLGMVKFGYAQTIEEMIERSKYDLIYLENMSLFIDLKIILYTIRTVATGKGM